MKNTKASFLFGAIKPPVILYSIFDSANLRKKAVWLIMLLHLTNLSFAQNSDTVKTESHFSGAVSVTNNGISLIPTFSLGKPAVIFNMSIGKRKLSFEPEFRFALEGKPWSFLFWWRYKLVETDKFLINLGAHPALNFRTIPISTNGVSNNVIVSRRYLAGELSPNYLLTKNISVGMYYLYSRGIDKDATRNTHFLTINSKFSNIKLTEQFYMRVTPQLYYLKQDAQDGFYATSTFTLAKRNFPLSLSAIINKTIQTDITASKNLVWNATLVYSFSKKYAEL